MLEDMVEYGAIVVDKRDSREAALRELELKMRGSITGMFDSNYNLKARNPCVIFGDSACQFVSSVMTNKERNDKNTAFAALSSLTLIMEFLVGK